MFRKPTKPILEPGFEEATPVLLKHPSPHFDRVTEGGYVLYYKQVEGALWIVATLGATQVGHADFATDTTLFLDGPRATSVHCNNVTVLPEHQRRGIATAIYLLAERITGLPVDNSWEDSTQSEDAKGFWAQPNRPFGKKS